LIPDIGGMAGKSYEDLKPSEAEIKLTWPAALNHALLALSGADVAVYCVDARRLSAEPQWEPTTWGDFSRGGRPGRPPAVSPRPMATSKNRTMIEIASHTGGSAYFDTNDIKSVVRNIVEGSRLSYSLGFYPASARGDGSLHTISVRVDRRGVSVHSRRGYFDTPEEPSPENSFRAMLASSLEATGLGLTARARLIEPTRLAVEVQVEPDGLTSREKAGKPIVQLDLALVPIDEGGIKCPCAMEPVTRELLRTGVKFDGALEFAQTATMLRVLVRDRLSGAMGSVTIPASKFRH
ncbi:MAG: VWA domain-containing protein, partial [Acidobacteria bacterium]|nr:VWA domain-containing protein [Acidobacteriota bacterium]